MRNLLFAFALIVTGVSVAEAQPQRAGRPQAPPHAPVLNSWPLAGNNSVGRYLLSRKDVQTELKLSADAVSKIEAILTKVKSDVAADQAAIKAKQKPATPVGQIFSAANEQLTALLDKSQNDRLHQISLQQRGVEAFIFPDVQHEVGLTAAEVSQIEAVLTTHQAAVRKLNADLKAGTLTKDQYTTQMRDSLKEFYKNLNAAVTPEEHKKLIELEAPRFKFTKA
jgi:hypothetical protein